MCNSCKSNYRDACKPKHCKKDICVKVTETTYVPKTEIYYKNYTKYLPVQDDCKVKKYKKDYKCGYKKDKHQNKYNWD